ncbi:uncharacterized protein LOC112890146 isoform X6 [Panicum hallii]|uniref:uncharacterized protein LOC112890146 isoform X6 n=1 Tax=Panicum hallii TaxID=206008 RepID=UPI000DF4D80A|nr:uncharacterized protein LOC112890146 isoform X6 [Panicum hallii]
MGEAERCGCCCAHGGRGTAPRRAREGALARQRRDVVVRRFSSEVEEDVTRQVNSEAAAIARSTAASGHKQNARVSLRFPSYPAGEIKYNA